MNTIEVKTNIMCDACIAKVTPVLNAELGDGKWKVDTANPQKILTVEGTDKEEWDVIQAVQKAGYKAEMI